MTEPTLTLYIANGDKYGFYLHEFVLSEGISMLSEANLTLYSTKDLTLEDLRKLISSAATVKISQKKEASSADAGEMSDTVSRYYSGMITSVKHCGMVQKTFVKHSKTVQETSDVIVCRYMLKIESPLVRLRYAFPRRYSTEISAADLITQILGDHNIRPKVPQKLYSEIRSFNQGDCSDYDFLLRIFGEYDLNYIFKSSSSQRVEPQMHIFFTQAETVSVTDPAPKEKILTFDCSGTSGADHVMTSWEMSSSAGVDEVEIHYENTDGRKEQKYGSAADSKRKRVFNTAPFGMTEEDRVEKAAASLQAVFESSKEEWRGTTASLYAMPGMRINVKNFGHEEDIETLITASVLNVTAGWPSELGEEPGINPFMEVELRGCAPAANERLVTAESDVTAAMQKRFKSFLPAADTVDFFPGTVCSAEGKTEPRDAKAPLIIRDKEDTYAFSALTDNDKRVIVQLTMPLGGYNQGLFRMPRLGERILMQSDGNGKYFLHAYLPNTTDMPFADALKGSETLDGAGMTVLRHCAPGFTLVKSDKSEPHNKMPDYTPEDRDPDLRDTAEEDLILVKNPKGGPGVYNPNYVGAPNKTSEFGIYSNRQISADGKQMGTDVPLVGDHLRMISNGRFFANAEKDVEIQAKDIFFSAPGWKRCRKNAWRHENGTVRISGINSLEVDAADSIEVKVKNNRFDIAPGSIEIRATKYSGARGPLDAAIYMNGLGGVSVSGAKVNGFGFFGVSIGDVLGAALTAESGLLQLRGAEIEFATNPKYMVQRNMVKASSQLILELVLIIIRNTKDTEEEKEKFDEFAGNLTYGVSTVLDTLESGMDFVKDAKELSKDDELGKHTKRLSYFKLVFEMLSQVIDAVWQTAEAAGGESWMNIPIACQGRQFTVRHLLRLAALVFKITAWSIGVGLTLASMKSGRSSYIQLDADSWNSETVKYSALVNRQAQNHAPIQLDQLLEV